MNLHESASTPRVHTDAIAGGRIGIARRIRFREPPIRRLNGRENQDDMIANAARENVTGREGQVYMSG